MVLNSFQRIKRVNESVIVFWRFVLIVGCNAILTVDEIAMGHVQC